MIFILVAYLESINKKRYVRFQTDTIDKYNDFKYLFKSHLAAITGGGM